LIGKALWDIVHVNKPVQNITYDYAGAVPKEVGDNWMSMGPWKNAQTSTFRFTVKDPIGIKLSEFEWIYTWKYGAKYNNTGSYLSLAGIKVNHVFTHSFQSISVQARAFDPVNYGEIDEPIAGLDLEVMFTHKSPFFTRQYGCHLNVRGDGKYGLVICDQQGEYAKKYKSELEKIGDEIYRPKF